ncbi:MAG: GNAT family N-acetyltransferase [Deltaproteobacteria bacterium]|nr:GNAT family N-acetyltransferase [Deltaproteobacteria bacterium]
MFDRTPPARAPDGKLSLVTTRLELREAPRHRRVSMTGRDVALVHAQRPPLHFYRYLYATVGAPYLWWERREMDDAALGSIIFDDRVEIHVLLVDGVPAGFAELDRRRAGEVELAYFGLMPEFIGQGLGLPLLDRVVEQAWQADGVERVTVHYCSTDHPRALQVYQRIGFVPYDEVRAMIDDPRDRGLFPEHMIDTQLGVTASNDAGTPSDDMHEPEPG